MVQRVKQPTSRPAFFYQDDDDGRPKKPKKGLLGLGDRLAAKAAAIAKTAGSAIQAVSEACMHESFSAPPRSFGSSAMISSPFSVDVADVRSHCCGII